MLGSLAPRRRWLVAGCVLLALLAGAAALRALRPEPAVPGGVVPVLLVHGYDGAPESLATLARRLTQAGRQAITVTLPDRGRGDIATSARVVGRAVERTGAAQVDLVGYSAGGIVVRAWLAEPGNAARARRVVLLGAPNHGADLAALAAGLDPGLCSGACLQLVPGSALLARLNGGDETPDGPAYTSIWTDRDSTVTPPTSALLDGALNVRVQEVCPAAPIAHGGLVRDPLALGLVVRALDGRLERPPGPADCAGLRALGAAPAAS